MKTPLLTAALLLSLGTLSAHACPEKVQPAQAYQRRNDGRCEGIQARGLIADGVKLVSFAIGRFADNPDETLSLKIPKLNQGQPTLQIQNRRKRYVLNEVPLKPQGAWLNYAWSPQILQEAKVKPSKLQTLAELPNKTYVPVVLNSGSKQYEFVFFLAEPASFESFEIRQGGQIFHSETRPKTNAKEIRFIWQPKAGASAGIYEINYEATTYPRGEKPDSFPRTLKFIHDPDWL
ncbi:MAG: hypothetical protein AAGG02_09840 [Cyanobacteria bacterium P01_H01_bin.15]